jgi:hypothetical protein
MTNFLPILRQGQIIQLSYLIIMMIRDIGNFHLTRRSGYVISAGIPKYYINNPSRLIKTAVGSGGVEAAALSKQSSGHTVRLSISPSQGDDPGFKSRPEHPLFEFF